MSTARTAVSPLRCSPACGRGNLENFPEKPDVALRNANIVVGILKTPVARRVPVSFGGQPSVPRSGLHDLRDLLPRPRCSGLWEPESQKV